MAIATRQFHFWQISVTFWQLSAGMRDGAVRPCRI